MSRLNFQIHPMNTPRRHAIGYVNLDGVAMVSYGNTPRDNVYYETYGAVASSSGQGGMEEHISRSMKKVQSKDLKSGCLIGKGPSSIVYETTLEGKSYARKDFLRVPSYIFEREAAALVGLDHPNILRTYCWTVDEGSCSLVVELMDNDLLNLMQKIKDSRRKQSSGSGSASQTTHLIDLHKFITDGRNGSTGTVSESAAAAPLVYPFDLPEALKIMVQVAEGVKFLHDKGVAHGDLKPKNILVTSNETVSSSSLDENMAFKVTDFGLFWTKMKSRTLVSRRARNLELARWRAPELLELTGFREDEHGSSTDSDWDSDSSDETIDDLPQKFIFEDMERADIYNFAITCSQILTGEDPYPELSLDDLVGGILGGLRPGLPPTCPAQLSSLLKRCWGEKTERPSFGGIFSELKDLQASLTRSDTVEIYKNNITESSSSPIDSLELELVPEHSAASGQSGGGPKSSSAQGIHQRVDVPIGHEEHSIKDIQADSSKGTLVLKQQRMSGKASGMSGFMRKLMSSMSNERKEKKDISAPTKFYGGKLKHRLPELEILHRFSFCDIERMTIDFSLENIIRQEGSYRVYKGIQAGTGATVAVMRFRKDFEGAFEAFKMEIEMVSRLHHKYVVALVGYCLEHDPILIYENPDNGSLFDHLHGTSAGSTLNWRRLLHIALNAAQGLEYLHTGCSPSIIHRNVTSSNILLTPEFDAKIADFELAKLMSETEDKSVTTPVAGTFGYIDPEHLTTGRVSTKTDVYSFGVVLLELITGRLPSDQSMRTMRKDIARWVQEEELDDNNVDSILAPIVKASNPNMEAVWIVVDIAIRSVEPEGMDRPTMPEVVQELEGALTIEANPIAKSPQFFSRDFDISSLYNEESLNPE